MSSTGQYQSPAADSNSYGTNDAKSYGTTDTNAYGTTDKNTYGSSDKNTYGTGDTNTYGSSDARPDLPHRNSSTKNIPETNPQTQHDYDQSSRPQYDNYSSTAAQQGSYSSTGTGSGTPAPESAHVDRQPTVPRVPHHGSTLAESKPFNPNAPHGGDQETHDGSVPEKVDADGPPQPDWDKAEKERQQRREANAGGGGKAEYPEQIHAGKVGVGPSIADRNHATFGEKMTGFKEVLKGKVTHHPETAQHGRDLMTGELKRQEHEREDNQAPIKDTQPQQSTQQQPTFTGDERGSYNQQPSHSTTTGTEHGSYSQQQQPSHATSTERGSYQPQSSQSYQSSGAPPPSQGIHEPVQEKATAIDQGPQRPDRLHEVEHRSAATENATNERTSYNQ